MTIKLTLEDIFADDDLGLLDVKPKTSNAVSPDDRLLTSFEEINKFVKENNREPEEGGDIQEHKLASRLKSIRSSEKKMEALINFDQYDLLTFVKKPIESVDDIFKTDDLGILDEDTEDLFELKNVPKFKERESADYVARRKTCKNFDKYEILFKKCQKDLSLGGRKLLKFNEKHLKEGRFFVLNGILVFLEKIFNKKKDKNGKEDGRIHCIFENGTESGMLLRSLGKGLFENGKSVSENAKTDEKQFFKNFNGITDEDRNTGFIYVLKSLSKDEKLASIKNLYKIGFSSGPVEDRIINAENDPTYLMAPVSIITTFECYNFNPQKLEQLLHNFFGESCLNFDIFDKKGLRHTPREWFIAPLNIIERVVKLIIFGGIVNYKYDSDKEEIILR
jgi:hypothetical protein